jgi:hypothetical protein
MPRQIDVSRLSLRGLRRHAVHFASLRLDADRTRHSAGHRGPEILQKVHARTRILNQDCGRAMLCRQTDDLAAQVRIFEATPIDMNEIRIASMNKPSRACRIVVATARHHGDVPALDDPRFPGPSRQVVIGREPRPPDKIAFDRHRLLLILGGEKQASHFCIDRLQGLSALALRMENIAAPAQMRSAAPELNGLLLQRECWTLR